MAVYMGTALVLLALFGVFFVVYKHNRFSLWCGFMFCIFLGALLLAYAFLVIQSGIALLEYTLVGAALLLMLVLLFGLYVLIALLFWNARLMAKRERRSLSNRLTLLAGLGLLALVAVSFIMQAVSGLPGWVRAIWTGILYSAVFYFFHIFVFLASVLLCNLARPKKCQQYIVVLGSGLVGGKVPPLLAARINRAVRFYKQQAQKGVPPPRLVMSGGQGSDESRAEALAMRDYAVNAGVAKEDILVEKAAANTAQNMAFSKQLMDEASAGAPYRCIFATSNYHLLRAGMLARRAGLPINGIGSKTALYYLPNALLREYIAYFSLYRHRLLITTGLFFLFGLATYFLPGQLASYLAGG